MKRIYILLLSISIPVSGVDAQQREFSSYGYIDLEFEYDTHKRLSTFDIHHFNLITTYSFEQFRIFSEIEWEHGPKFESNESEGEIALERAWFEYLHSDRFKVRAGKFLTPFGFYNLIHDATPTFLTTSLPFLYHKHNPFGVKKDRLYAKFYTGLQVSGTVRNASGVRFRYTFGIGNGRGDEQFSADNDTNKSLIARLQVQSRRLEFGLSHYRDRYETGLSGKARAREQATGVDLTVREGGFQVRSEYARFRLESNDVRPGFQHADSYYGQISYRIRDRVTPVLRYDRFDPDRGASNDAYRQWLVGLNISPHPQIYLKTEVQFKTFEAPGVQSRRLYLSSVSVAF